MAITKAMLARCKNEKMQAFCALDEDVQEAMKANWMNQQTMDGGGAWVRDTSPDYRPSWAMLRLSPDTPTEQEYEECKVFANMNGILGTKPSSLAHREFAHEHLYLTSCSSHKDFIGIVYTLNGVETLRTSVDAAFGKPVRVRFAK